MIDTVTTRLMRGSQWFLLGLAGLLVTGYVVEHIGDIFFDHFFSIDACLDSGGAWDYKYERCVHAIPDHPNPQYQKIPEVPSRK